MKIQPISRNKQEAEKMIAFGLSGNPPSEILEELRKLLISDILPLYPVKPIPIPPEDYIPKWSHLR